jgi:altronate hydrolase
VQINGRSARQPGRRAVNIYEKSRSARRKGGTGPLMAVYKYAEPVTTKGFFMDTPGFY